MCSCRYVEGECFLVGGHYRIGKPSSSFWKNNIVVVSFIICLLGICGASSLRLGVSAEQLERNEKTRNSLSRSLTEEFEFNQSSNYPANDRCHHATTLDTSRNDIVYIGTTLNATFEPSALVASSEATCYWGWNPDVWFTVNGKGTGLRLTSCHDSSLRSVDFHVYQGTNCASLECLSVFSSGCHDIYGRNTLEWFAEMDQVYYIAASAPSHAQGSFSLNLSGFNPAKNDVCEGSPVVTVDEPLLVSTRNATPKPADQVGQGPDDIFPGAFYSVMGTGRAMKATVPCVHYRGSYLYVYGGTCGSLTPIGSKAVCNPDTVASWQSVAGEVYHILYTSNSAAAVELTVTSFDPPGNNMCSEAEEVVATASPLTIRGTTTDATVESLLYSRNFWAGEDSKMLEFPGSGFDFVDQTEIVCGWRQERGVWYRIVGRGRGVRVSTCQESGQQMFSVSVYQGRDCNSLQCVVNYPTSCGDSTTLNSRTWFGFFGVQYFVHVSTAENIGEPFTMEVVELDSPPNDICSQASVVNVGDTVNVVMQDATAEFIGDGRLYDWDGSVLPGVYYRVAGSGNVMKASAPCFPGTTIRIYSFTGTCNELRRVGEKVVCEPNYSASFWETTDLETYYILVQSSGTEPVELRISEERPELNDLCTGALGPINLGQTVFGDTAMARNTPQYRRRVRERDLLSLAPPGLYYYVEGTGNTFTLSSPCSDGSSLSSKIYVDVFAGACREDWRIPITSLTNGAWCDPDYSVTWPTNVGEIYYIHATPDFYGTEFEFTVTEAKF